MSASSSSSAAGGIQSSLHKLHAILGETETRNVALICHDIIGDLGQECMVTKSENELGESSSHTQGFLTQLTVLDPKPHTTTLKLVYCPCILVCMLVY